MFLTDGWPADFCDFIDVTLGREDPYSRPKVLEFFSHGAQLKLETERGALNFTAVLHLVNRISK